MTCNDYLFMLDDRLDGRLDEAREEALDAHLRTCAACRAEAAAIARADAAFLLLPEAEPPVNIAAAVSRRIAREAPAEAHRGWFWGVFALATALAAVVWHAGFTPGVIWGDAPVAALLGPVESVARAWWEPVRIALGAASPLFSIFGPFAVALTMLELGLASLFVVRRTTSAL